MLTCQPWHPAGLLTPRRPAGLLTTWPHLTTPAGLIVPYSPLLPIPEPRLPIPAPNQSIEIKRVEERPQKPPRILIPRAHDLRDAISPQIQLRALGEILPRMPEIPQPRIRQHQRRLKHIKEPLIPDLGPQRHGVEPRHDMQVRRAPVLDDAIHGPHRDQRAARVQRAQHRRQVVVADARGDAPPVEGRGEGEEERDDDDLDQERGFEERFAGVLRGGRQGLVGGARGADAGEGLDYGGDEGEGGEDAAWVNGGEMWDVEEDAAEDLVVGEFVQWPALGVGISFLSLVYRFLPFAISRAPDAWRTGTETDSRRGIY